MTLYQRIQIRVFLMVVLGLVLVWGSFHLFASGMTGRLHSEYVKSQMLAQKLHLIDQSQRPKRFEDLISLLERVDSSSRREVLEGPEIKKWYYYLLHKEQARLMEEILPQPLTRLIKRYLELPDNEQATYLYSVCVKLLGSGELPLEIQDQLKGFNPNHTSEYKAKLLKELKKDSPEKRYYRILRILFLKLNDSKDILRAAEQGEVSVLEGVVREFQEK